MYIHESARNITNILAEFLAVPIDNLGEPEHATASDAMKVLAINFCSF